MERRLILLIVCTIMVCGLAATGFADNVIRREFVPVDETPQWVEDEFIVVLKPAFKSGFDIQHDKRANKLQVSIASIQQLVDRHGVTGLKRQFAAAAAPELEAYYTVKLAPGQDLDLAIAAFAADPAVDHVEKIGIHPLLANCATGTLRPANDTYYNNPPVSFNWPQWDLWNTKGIDAEMAWNVQTGDATVVVVAMDSGVKYTHKDLGGNNPPGPADNVTDGNVWVNPFETPGNGVDDEGNGFIDDVVGYDFVTGVSGCAAGEDCSTVDNNPMDFNGHGTHTAGTMVALTNNARSVAGIAGGFGDGTTASVGNGCKVMCMRIGWSDAAGNGFVNMSFAAQAINYVVGMKQRGVNIAAINCSWGSSNSGGLGAALDAAMNNDILICKAAGNSNSSIADYMGNRTEILNVAATDTLGLRANFSNFGTWVDIAAPGTSIISTYQVGTDPVPDYVAVLDGTSMAAPHCAAVAGLLESQNSSLTRAQKFTIMTTNTCAAGSSNIGGILNAKKALDAAGGAPQPPVAAFVGSPTSGCGPLNVNFTDQSTNSPTSWSWDFGDGGTSTLQNPAHAYTAPGSYTVTLTATNAAGSDQEIKVGYISVTSGTAPVADFSGTPTTGDAPLAVNFTDLSSGSPSTWSWTFGDGGTSTAQNPSYVYNNPGTYNVTLTVTNACGSDGETKVGYVVVTGGVTWTVITSDNFETGFGNYTDGGTDCIRNTSATNAHQGVASIDIQDNTSTSLFSHTTNKNVSGYNTLEITFWAKAVSMEAGEDFWVQYSSNGGSTWTTVADFNSGTEFTNGVWFNPTVTLRSSQISFTTTARIRFRCDASNDADDVYIDEVVFRGTTAVLSAPSEELVTPMESANPVPREYGLDQNYPNPFNAGTIIPFSLNQSGDVELVVYDILGRTVRRLAAGYYDQGSHVVAFDGRDEHGAPLSSGVYLYRLTGPNVSQTRKMVLVK